MDYGTSDNTRTSVAQGDSTSLMEGVSDDNLIRVVLITAWLCASALAASLSNV